MTTDIRVRCSVGGYDIFAKTDIKQTHFIGEIMIVLIIGASHTGKTALAQKYKANYILIEDKYEISID